MSSLSTTLIRSLAVGLLCTLPLFDTALSASVLPRQDVVEPRAAIAIKLSPEGGTGNMRTAQSGTDIVDGLVRKAHPSIGSAKRDVDFKVLPLITSLSPEKIAEMVERATKLDPTYEAPDFGAWFQVVFTESTAEARTPEIDQLLNNLAGYPEVTSCQPLAGARPPAIDPSNDPLFPSQDYLDPSDAGINSQYAWGFPGGDGAGTTVIDIERGWKLDHEDYRAANIDLLAGLNVNDRLFWNFPHGTAVLGEMFMVDNNIGGVGAIPGARGHVVGITRNVGPAPVENQPEAIMDAASFLNFGDAMLLEMQVTDASGAVWPVEIYDAEFDAIRLAVAMGITVVEPAANNGSSLDRPVTRPGSTTARSLLNKNSADFRESGAIMVGSCTSRVPHRRHSTSNYGSRVDVYSWGENIATTGVTSSFEDIYTTFSGTSGASPIIVGAAMAVQGIVNVRRGSKLGPAALRDLIKKEGTPSASSSDRIGVQPDLRALIDGGYLN